MRILCTGAAGFIGSHLGDALWRKHNFFGFDNFLTGKRENWPDAEEIDIVDRQRLYEFANEVQPELVIHCAASYSDPDKWHRDTQTNVEGGINAALVAKHHNARLIYFQTILPASSSYAISKIASEHYQRLSGQPLTVFRLGNVYGPRNLSGPVPVFYSRITEGKPCVVVDTTRDFFFISDLVRAVDIAIEQELTGTFDVCSGRQVPIMDMFLAIAKELGHEEVPPLIPPAPDDVQGEVSTERGVPGWKVEVPLAEGIAQTIAFYREGELGDTYTHLRLKG
jgi:UDP-glucose 4-epimerase